MNGQKLCRTTPAAHVTYRVPVNSRRFGVAETWVGDIVAIVVSGELDLLTAPRLTDVVEAAIRRTPAALVVDLSKVSFLGAAGMNALTAAQRHASPAVRFGVVADGPATSRPLVLLGIDASLAIYPTLAEALHDVI